MVRFAVSSCASDAVLNANSTLPAVVKSLTTGEGKARL